MRKQTIKNKEAKKTFLEKQKKAHKVKKTKNQAQVEKEKKVSLLTQSNVKGLLLTKEQLKLKIAGNVSRSSGDKPVVFFDNLINVETTAEVLGVAPKTIRKWVSIRFIPYLKLGSRVMFRPKSLELWLNQKENKSWL